MADIETKFDLFKLKTDSLIKIKKIKFSFKALFWIVTKSSPTLVILGNFQSGRESTAGS